MNIQTYCCPICNKHFVTYNLSKILQKKIFIDIQYSYYLFNVLCNNCKKSINGINFDIPILWEQNYQYRYDKYVVNKNIRVTNNKKFLYLYFPKIQENILINILTKIKYEKFDAILLPKYFYQLIKDKLENKQLCIITDDICFIQSNLLPNYLLQMILLNQSAKYLNSQLYSIYTTFSNKFNKLFYIKDYQKFKLKLKQEI